jgi:SAM-dependent methyltransferase
MPPEPDLSRLIPLSARVVLDVGCGQGELGAAYRRLNPRARLLAIDNDPAMAAAARPSYDDCAVADAEAPFLPFDPPGGIDCIVYNGILEHLHDPFAMLRRHAAALSRDGTMAIRVPNVRHWSQASRLLRGASGAGDLDLPERGQHFWFGIETMFRALKQAGLCPVEVQPRTTDEAAGRAFIDAIAPALRNLGVDPADYARTALPRHYIWRIRLKPVRRIVIAGDLLPPIGGVSHVRVIHPLTAMASDPAVSVHLAPAGSPPPVASVAAGPLAAPPAAAAPAAVALMAAGPLAVAHTAGGPVAAVRPAAGPLAEAGSETSGTPHIFILHRPALFGAEGQLLINGMIEKGWLVVTEFDDHPDFMRGLANPALVSFRGVHAVQTTTPALAAVLRPRNPELALFPNAIVTLPDIRNFVNPRVLTVFFGALNREPDWRPVMGAINAVAARAGERLRFRVVHDEGFFRALETPNKTFTPLCDYDTYLDLLGRSEISLMPLDDTPFNRAKSDLKFIEAGACRVAALASSVVYRDSIAHGETGLIFDNPGEFHRQLLRLATIPDLALELGNNARRMVIEQRMLASQVEPRIAWYRDLWERRVALTAALRARIEGLPLPVESW